MKGLGANRSRHLSDSCEPTGVGGGGGGPQKPSLCSLTSSDPRGSFLLSPSMNHYATLDPRLHHYGASSPVAPLPPDCLLSGPFGQVSNSSTFPRLHFTSQQDQVDCPQSCGVGSGQISRTGTLPTSMSMGMGLGLQGLQGLSGAPMITSGSATISSAQAAKMNRLPANLLDHLERHLPLQRDGFSTLQFHRGRMSKQRSESPGRIRHLMHSVQKLFAKSQSLETGNNANNGRTAGVGGCGGGGTVGGGGGNEDGGGGCGGGRPTGRSKSKDRGAVKTEGGPSKQHQQRAQCRPNALALWNSDDALMGLDTDATKAGTIAVGYRNPLSMMTLGRAVSDSQAPPRLLPQGYHTISASHSHMLKTSKSSGDLKFLACQATQVVSKEDECRIRSGKKDPLVKRGSWSSMTLSQARQVLQKGSATVNRTLLKSKSCHQDLACNYLQVPLGEWTAAGTLGGRGGGRAGGGGGTEIPCRRMRSGSYVKAMGDVDVDSDEEDSEGSPKPSPKSAARRQSYLKATQRSLSEQHPPPPPPPRNTLPSLKELNTNRSLDNLDCLVSPVDPHPPPRHWDSDFSQGFGTLGRGVGSQVCGQSCGRSLASMPVLYCEGTGSQAVEALDLPAPTCFRSRSHSYLRAIQAGCSQDDDTASLSSDSPPPNATGHLYCSIGRRTKAPPPIPPRCSASSKPLISVTVQSSTESAQDTYLEHRHDNNSQSGDSNTSSDSLCSIRTGSLAKGPAHHQAPPSLLAPAPTSVLAPTAAPVVAAAAAVAPAPVPAPREAPPTITTSSSSIVTCSSVVSTSTSSTSVTSTTSTSTSTSTSTQPQNDTLSLAPVTEKSPAAEPKRKLSSIGIQVDCFLPISREDLLPLSAPLRFQSVGVQVENGRPLSRVSSMASRQNTETDPQETPDDAPPPPSDMNCSDAHQTPNGENDSSTIATPPTTATEALRVPCSSQQEPLVDPALDPSSLPPPDPSLGTGNCVGGGPGDCSSSNSSGGPAPSSATPTCFRDGNCFLKLLQAETARMEGWCQQMEAETKDNQLSEEVLGTIRSAVGSAQLLMAKKFQQFRGLCNENLNVEANPRPTAQDLAGFWDLLQLTIEDISMKFDELYQLKANNWQLPEKPEKKERKALPSSVPKKSSRPKLSAGGKESPRSVDSTAADKQRQEARKRLMAAKRAASVRQNSATESADSIEIYVPEAQTRL